MNAPVSRRSSAPLSDRRQEDLVTDRTPTPIQRIRYIFGRPLPSSMQEWVLRDQTGPGATRRYLQRFLLPPIPLLCLFALVPGPWWMGVSMAALVFLPLAFFAVALVYVHRRHMLVKHGLDPVLADPDRHRRAAEERASYERRHNRG
ncbi:DUF5313 domain-containing protein [Nocardia flavorosea]|uniref:DUF5313 domain-containing protein n=1 Tax=Nocardia flavorosea TaxID=53429 RepID=A0A846YPD2_9NOCA|nr:DUF5313 domain-containing protein [Nocardia flavorosea]